MKGIIGFANGGKERSGEVDYDGELYAIYLLKSYQRRGIGQALLKNVARHLGENGLHSMLIRALADNTSSCRFYESLGGVSVREQEVEFGGKEFKEIEYGWTDITLLMNGFRTKDSTRCRCITASIRDTTH